MNNAFFKNPIVAGIITVILFVLPSLIAAGGTWQSLTIGGILTALYKALENTQSGLTVAGNVKPLV
jgi:hypothetical protein